MWWLLLDLGFLVLFACTVYFAAKRGFFATLISLAAYVLALLGAKGLSSSLAPQIYERHFASQMREAVAARLDGIAPTDYSSQVDAAYQAMPGYVRGIAQMLGISNEKISDVLQTAPQAKQGVIDNVMTYFVAPVATAAIRFILFAVIALVLALVLRVVGEVLIRVIKHLPVIKQIDTGLGVVLGVIRGVLLVLILALCLSVIAGSVNQPAFMEAVDQSKVESVVRNFLNSISGYVPAK
ncbi:MAG: CvpA family protein [Clostridia bacterium]|nr:CvpA family protein [Clostridia bacterium]MBR3552371.1 CvpA family protein [Clostridia bacterium]